MTKEEFENLTFRKVSHVSMFDSHSILYVNDDTGLRFQVDIRKLKNGDFGKERKTYCWQGKWYSEKQFINNILDTI